MFWCYPYVIYLTFIGVFEVYQVPLLEGSLCCIENPGGDGTSFTITSKLKIFNKNYEGLGTTEKEKKREETQTGR